MQAPELRLLLCLKLIKTTYFLPPPGFRPVRTHFDLVARQVSAKRSNPNLVVAATSFHH